MQTDPQSAIVRRSFDERIDFVSDPVILKEYCEKSSQNPERPPAAGPQCSPRGELHGKVDEIGGAVENICDQREDEELQEGNECERRPEMRPTCGNPDDDNRGEGEIIENAAQFPITEGIVEQSAERLIGRVAGAQ